MFWLALTLGGMGAEAMTLEGRVLASPGFPLSKVEVRAESRSGCSVVSQVSSKAASVGAEGRFQIQVPRPGVWSVEVLVPDGRSFTLATPVAEYRRLAPLDLDENSRVGLWKAEKPPAMVWSETRRLKLALRDAEGEPVADALVMLPDRISCFGVSDPEGWVDLRLPLDSRRLAVHKEGFEHASIPVEWERADLKWVLNPIAYEHHIRVSDPEGFPVEDVEVQSDGQSFFSNREGLVKLSHLSPRASATLTLLKKGFHSAEVRSHARIPGVISDFTLSWISRITGTVVSEGGGAANVELCLSDGSRCDLSAADGTFELYSKLSEPTFLRLGAGSRIGKTMPIRQNGKVRWIDLGEISFDSGTQSIRGWVQDSAGNPVSTPEIFLDLSAENSSLEVSPSGRPLLPRVATGGEDGYFSIPGWTGARALSVVAWRKGHSALSLTWSEQITEPLNFFLPDALQLSGQVVSAESGEGLPGVGVSFSGKPGSELSPRISVPEFATDEDGRFELRVPPGSRWQLQAELWEFGTRSYTVEIGSADQEIEILLPPAATLTGFVLDGAGDPVEGVQLLVDYGEGPASIDLSTTNGDGTFTLHFLRAGPANLQISGAGIVRSEAQLDLKPGFNQHDFSVTRPSSHSLQGVAVDAEGLPIANLQIQVVDSDLSSYQTSTEDDGSFVFETLPAGLYRIVSLDDRWMPLDATREVVLNRDEQGWIVRFDTGCLIQGAVDGVSVHHDWSVVAVWHGLEMVGSLDLATGGFSFSGLRSGPWQVDLIDGAGSVLASARAQCGAGKQIWVKLAVER